MAEPRQKKRALMVSRDSWGPIDGRATGWEAPWMALSDGIPGRCFPRPPKGRDVEEETGEEVWGEGLAPAFDAGSGTSSVERRVAHVTRREQAHATP